MTTQPTPLPVLDDGASALHDALADLASTFRNALPRLNSADDDALADLASALANADDSTAWPFANALADLSNALGDAAAHFTRTFPSCGIFRAF